MKHPVHPVNVHKDYCLCGSGRLLCDCCLCVRSNTTSPNPPTGYAHQRCFARGLNDCSRKISREHYISDGVLRLFGSTAATVSGLPWLPNREQKQVSLSSLSANMLCVRHNQALSALDATGANFFKFFVADWSEEAVEIYLVRGYDLERWLLKTLCGLVASGNAALGGERLLAWAPPMAWLEILFGSADVQAPAGLHAISATKYEFQAASLRVNPVFKTSTQEPIAVAIAVEGVAFLFAMEALPPMRQPSRFGSNTHYRPSAFQLRRSGQIREAHFGWPDGRLVRMSLAEEPRQETDQPA